MSGARKWARLGYAAAWGVWLAVVIPITIASVWVGEWLAVPARSPDATTEGTVMLGLFLGFIYLTPGLLLLGRDYFARKLRAQD